MHMERGSRAHSVVIYEAQPNKAIWPVKASPWGVNRLIILGETVTDYEEIQAEDVTST